MLKIEDLKSAAANARIKLSQDEEKAIFPELQEIIKAFEILAQADVSGTEPIFIPIKVKHKLREDKPKCEKKNFLNLAKLKENNYFCGPICK